VEIKAAVLSAMSAASPYVASQPLVLETLQLDPPGPGEVLVRIKAAGLCHSDLSVINGNRPRPMPMALGHEAAGIVEEVGPVEGAKSDLAPGDHVVFVFVPSCGHCEPCTVGRPALCEPGAAANGTGTLLSGARRLRRPDGSPVNHHLGVSAFADYATVSRHSLVKVDKDLPLNEAALFGCAVLTGVGAVFNTAQVPAGSQVVVIGTGGVGLNSVQGAALAGARSVIAVDLSDSKLVAARRFGASHTLNPAKEDLPAAVRQLTEGRGADFVFVTVGAKMAIEQSFQLLARGGSSVLVGMPPTGVITGFEPTDLASSGQRVLGSKMGSSRIRIDVPMLVDLYRQGRLKLDELISGRFPLEEVNAAVAGVIKGEALRNVIVFR
jgi:alcohol dehydrogenase